MPASVLHKTTPHVSGIRDEIRLAAVIIGENMLVASLQVVFPFFEFKTCSIFNFRKIKSCNRRDFRFFSFWFRGGPGNGNLHHFHWTARLRRNGLTPV